ncbi:MAG: N-6 DNA methylase [Nitrospira sp.]|nr:N-6 DNA methylase [Nitrospira sp.]
MAQKPISDMSTWPSLTLEGNLIAPAMVAQIAEPKDDINTRESYGIRKGLTIRDEISTAFRVGQSHFDAFTKLENQSAEATCRFIRDFLKETFGFDDLVPAEAPLAFLAGKRIPIVVVPPAEDKLDRRSPSLSTDRSRSPAFALQDYLNEHDNALWGLVTNGTLIRLMRDNASLTRPAYIEADLAQIFSNEDAASFSALWLTIHRSRFGVAGTPATDCALELWRAAGSREGEVARDRLADQVQLALKVLGSGFLEANPDLATKLKSGEINLTDWFNQLLRLVYRLIFMMVAEDRNLLHPEKAKPEPRTLYADGYSLTALRAQCIRAATWDKHYDRFESIKIVFRALAHGEERLALPALGGLFAEDKLPHLQTARLQNKAFMDALYRLSWLSDKSGMVPVNWRAMETEELGSVYESLLELQPQLGDDGKTLAFASETAEQRGNQRKTTGSYYTPDSLVQALLDTALDPVLEKTEAEADDPAKTLLKLSVIDPACGSGHFLLAAARRIATRLARIRTEGTPSLADFRHALRDVARCCIHGVDRNPMAVELTKVALWIETVDPGLPLGFFDAQIRCGDALLGVFDLKALQDGIPDAAYKPLTGDDKDTAKYYLQVNRDTKKGQGGFDFGTGQATMPTTKPLAVDFSAFRGLPEDTVEQIDAKSKRFADLHKDQLFIRARAASDLYVAAFLLPKTGGVPSGASTHIIPTTEDVWRALDQGKILPSMSEVSKATLHARVFHWPLEFPDIMQRGGFDVVLGNPPWDVMQLGEEEYFATRKPEIAALTGAARKKAIAALEHDDPAAFAQFTRDKRQFESSNEFARESGRFDLTARGKVNTYSLFAELFANLARQRAGVIVPTGIATDFTTRFFFEDLVRSRRIVSALMFDNAWKIFPAIHPDTPFALLTIGATEQPAEFASYLLSTEHLADRERRYRLFPEEIMSINPNTKTAPLFRSRADAELTAKIYANVPVLIDEGTGANGNPWGVEFRQGLFNMTSDSHLFRTAAQLAAEGFARDSTDWRRGSDRLVPLYEAKMIHQFDHRWAGYAGNGEDSADIGPEQKADPGFEPAPRYWVPDSEVTDRLASKGWRRNWLMGWRDITNATNERTVIATVIPRVGVGNNLPLMLFSTAADPRRLASLAGSLSSLACDFATRFKVGGTHLNFFIYQQLPILPPAFYTESRLAFIVPRVLELTYTSHSLAPFARDLGHDGPPFAWDEDRRAHLRADLDAFYARAYGLIRDELRYILDPADVKGPDYPSETFRVLKEREIREYGEYRTRRLVLAAWDRLEARDEFTAMGM